MISLRKAVLLATGEQQFALGANFVVAVATSRLMSPNEIGVTVVGMSIVNVATSLREYATSTYLIKHADLCDTRTKGALTGILAFNVLLTLALALGAPIFGSLYTDERLTTFLQIVAVGLLAEALAQPVVAVARRDMAVDKAAMIGASGTATMACVTIALAALGWGYISFAIGILCGFTATALAAAVFKPKFWFFRPTLDGAGDLFKFGKYNGTHSVLRAGYESVPYLILGHILPLEVVAYFHRALMLSQLPGKLLLSGVDVLMLPALSAEARQGRDLKRPFIRTLQCVTVVYWPALILLAILAHPIVTTLYGAKWDSVAPVAQIMALGAMAGFLGKFDGSVLVAAGGLSDMVKRSMVAFPLCAAISAASAFFGVYALAWSTWLTYPLQLGISLYFVRKHVPFTWGELASALSHSALVTAVCVALPLLILAIQDKATLSFSDVLLAALAALVGWLAALRFNRHPMLSGLQGPQVSARSSL
ncbi:MAG: oligosaccharide flippase family protein [Hyphomicrobium sp.]